MFDRTAYCILATCCSLGSVLIDYDLTSIQTAATELFAFWLCFLKFWNYFSSSYLLFCQYQLYIILHTLYVRMISSMACVVYGVREDGTLLLYY